MQSRIRKPRREINSPEDDAGHVEKQFYRRADIAYATGLSVRSVDKALSDGRQTRGRVGLWPQFKMGRSLLVPARSIDRWIRRDGAITPITEGE